MSSTPPQHKQPIDPTPEGGQGTHTTFTGTASVDPQEIDKFGALASQWWDPQGEFRTLHDINPLRIDYINKGLAAHNSSALKGQSVVDVGCGGGLLSEAMAHQGAKVLGIDLAEASLSVARLHALESGVQVEYRQLPVEQLAEEAAGRYDVVTCLEMLEHVPEPAQIIAACAKLAKPGGILFFSTLNRNTKSWLQAIVAAETILKLLPSGTHDHHRFIKPSELALWCRQSHLQLQDLTGLTYNPLTKRYRLCQDVSVNYLATVIKPANG